MPTVSKGYNSAGQSTFTEFTGYDKLVEIPFSPNYEDQLSQFKIVESSDRVTYIYKNPIDIHGGTPYTFAGTGGYSRDGIVKSNNFSGYKYWFRCFLTFSSHLLAVCAEDNLNPNIAELQKEIPGFKDGNPHISYDFGTGHLINDISGVTASTLNAKYAGDFLEEAPQTFLGTTKEDMGYTADLDWMKELYVQNGQGWRAAGVDKVQASVNLPDGSCWLWDQYFGGQRLQNAGSAYPVTQMYSSPLFLATVYQSKISVWAGTSFLLYTDLLNVTPRPWTYYVVKSNWAFNPLSAPDNKDKLPGVSNLTSGNTDFGYIYIVGVEQ